MARQRKPALQIQSYTDDWRMAFERTRAKLGMTVPGLLKYAVTKVMREEGMLPPVKDPAQN